MYLDWIWMLFCNPQSTNWLPSQVYRLFLIERKQFRLKQPGCLNGLWRKRSSQPKCIQGQARFLSLSLSLSLSVSLSLSLSSLSLSLSLSVSLSLSLSLSVPVPLCVSASLSLTHSYAALWWLYTVSVCRKLLLLNSCNFSVEETK